MCQNFMFSNQVKKDLKIAIISDKKKDDAEFLLKMLKENIDGLLATTKIEYSEVFENNFDYDEAKQIYSKLTNSEYDLVLSFGTINTLMIYEYDQKRIPTIILGDLNTDFIELSEDQNTSNIENIAIHILPSSYKDDLKILKSLYDYKKIAVVVDEYKIDNLPMKLLFDELTSEINSEYEFILSSSIDDPDFSLAGFDASYLTSDYLSKEQFDKYLVETLKNKIPTISDNGIEDVEKGVLMTFKPELNYEYYIRKLSLTIESFVNGVELSRVPIGLDTAKTVSINFRIGSFINFPFRFSMLGEYNFVDGSKVELKPENSFSIIEIMNEVTDKNLLLNANYKNIPLAEQNYKTAKSSYYPNIFGFLTGSHVDPEAAAQSFGQNPEFSTATGVGLEQLIYSEQANANISIQESALNSQKELYTASELDALLNSTIAYFNALILKTNVQILNRNLALTKANLRIAEQNFEIGTTGRSDVLRLRSQLTQNIQDLINAGNSLSQTYVVINQLMNREISGYIEINDASLNDEIFSQYNYERLLSLLDDPNSRRVVTDFLVREAIKNAPELKSLEYNLDIADRSRKLFSYGRFIPTLSLQGNFNYVLNRSGAGSTVSLPIEIPGISLDSQEPLDRFYNIQATLSIPIVLQNQQNINLQTSKIQLEQLEIQKLNIKQSIESNVNDIIFELIKQISNIEISIQNEELAKESLELFQTSYKAGAVPLIQLLDAQNNYLQAQLIKANAQYNYLIVSMRLERVLSHFFLVKSQQENQEFFNRATEYIQNNRN